VCRPRISAAKINFDFQSTIKIKEKTFFADPRFLAIHMTESQLQGVKDARNKTDHQDYEHLLNKKQQTFLF
jgi:hypothetical protein